MAVGARCGRAAGTASCRAAAPEQTTQMRVLLHGGTAWGYRRPPRVLLSAPASTGYCAGTPPAHLGPVPAEGLEETEVRALRPLGAAGVGSLRHVCAGPGAPGLAGGAGRRLREGSGGGASGNAGKGRGDEGSALDRGPLWGRLFAAEAAAGKPWRVCRRRRRGGAWRVSCGGPRSERPVVQAPFGAARGGEASSLLRGQALRRQLPSAGFDRVSARALTEPWPRPVGQTAIRRNLAWVTSTSQSLNWCPTHRETSHSGVGCGGGEEGGHQVGPRRLPLRVSASVARLCPRCAARGLMLSSSVCRVPSKAGQAVQRRRGVAVGWSEVVSDPFLEREVRSGGADIDWGDSAKSQSPGLNGVLELAIRDQDRQRQANGRRLVHSSSCRLLSSSCRLQDGVEAARDHLARPQTWLPSSHEGLGAAHTSRPGRDQRRPVSRLQ
jgi:hypothetical protein